MISKIISFTFMIFIKTSTIMFIMLSLLVFCERDSTGLGNGKELCDPTKYIDTTRSYFYYYFDEKIYLTLADDLVYVKYDSMIDMEASAKNFDEYGLFKIGKFYDINSYLLKPPQERRAEEFYTFYGYDTDCGFGNQSIVKYATPVFWGRPGIDSTLIILTDEFIVNIDTSKYTIDELLRINKDFCVEFVDSLSMEGWYIFKNSKATLFNVLDIANLYQDSAYAISSAPNFKLFGGWLTLE